jgi:hypothetical protein
LGQTIRNASLMALLNLGKSAGRLFTKKYWRSVELLP